MPEPPPTTVGPYRLLAELGRGGSGTVYRALAPNGQEVALKLQRPSTPDDALYLEREYRLQAELGGDGILPLLDQGQTPAGHYATFPLLQGGDLAQRLLRAPLPWPEAVELVRVLARALSRLHAAGVVHRDLKPANVLLDRDGRPWLADLGLSKRTVQSPHVVSLTATGVLVGTPGYLAPEQAADAKRAGTPADVFALGALLYAAVVGRDPFGAATLGEYLERSARGEARPLREAAPEAPSWLEALVAQALDPDPARRPPDARAFLDALPPVHWRARQRGRTLGWVALALALALVASASVVAALRPSPEAPHPPDPSLAEAERAAACGDFAAAHENLSRALREDRSAATLCRRARAALELGRYDEALADAREAVELAPEEALPYVMRGRVRYALRRLDDAAADAERALELDPGLAAAHTLQGLLLLYVERDAAAALSCLTRALELDPSSSYARSLRAGALGMLGRDAEALQELETCLRAAPWSLHARLWRAELYFNAGRAEQGLREAERCVELAPEDPLAKRLLARGYAGNGRWREAIEAAEAAAILDPQDARTQHELGKHRVQAALATTGEEARRLGDQAEDAFTRALALDPTLAEARFDRAQLAASNDHPELALTDLDWLLERHPQDADLLAIRGALRIRFRPDELAQALADLDRALDLSPPAHQRLKLQKLRAAAFERLGSPAQAAEALDRCVEMDPREVGLRVARVRLWCALGRAADVVPEASALLAEVEVPSSRSLIYCYRGRAHLQRQEYAEAERDLKAAIREDATSPVPHGVLAEVYLASERPQDALQSAQFAVRADPGAHRYRASLARVLSVLGERERAVEAYREALKLGPPPDAAATYRDELTALEAAGQAPTPR